MVSLIFFVSKEPERLPEIADVIKDFDLLKRAPKLLKKMKVHLRKCLIKSEQSKKILAFDNFTGENFSFT